MAPARQRTALRGVVVKRRVLFAFLCLGASAPAALAANFAIKGSTSETLTASDNEFLKGGSSSSASSGSASTSGTTNGPAGPTYKSTTAGMLDFLAETPTTRYLFDTHFSYFKYFGPGAADTDLTWGTPANARYTIVHTTKLDTFNLGASWNRVDVATTQLAQTGNATGRGSADTYHAFGGVTHDLSRLDTISWSADGSTISYTDPSQTPYVDVTSTLTWTHSLSQLTTLNNSVYFDWLSEQNAQDSQRLFWRLQTGAQSQLTHRLKVSGNIGVVFVNAYQKGSALASSGVQAAPPPAGPQSTSTAGSTPFQIQVGAANALVGDIGLTFQATKTTTISLTAAQSIMPTITGQLQQSTTVGLNISHEINRLADLSAFAQFAESNSSGQIGQSSTSATNSFFYTASINYSYKLTRDWRTNLSYTYRQRDDSTGTARSNTVLFSLSRDLNLLGNPAPINEAERERKRERAQQAVGQVFPLYQ